LIRDKVYIRDATGREELYDLLTDPAELRDLSRSEDAQIQLGQFRAKMNQIDSESQKLQSSRPSRRLAPSIEPDEDRGISAD
jgi:hypothetical protein